MWSSLRHWVVCVPVHYGAENQLFVCTSRHDRSLSSSAFCLTSGLCASQTQPVCSCAAQIAKLSASVKNSRLNTSGVNKKHFPEFDSSCGIDITDLAGKLAEDWNSYQLWYKTSGAIALVQQPFHLTCWSLLRKGECNVSFALSGLLSRVSLHEAPLISIWKNRCEGALDLSIILSRFGCNWEIITTCFLLDRTTQNLCLCEEAPSQ